MLSGAISNEVVDRYAKSAENGGAPVEEIPEGYANETSLSHISRVATEAKCCERRSGSRVT